MRIAIMSAPRSGNHWIKCLLGTIYGLEELRGKQKPGSKGKLVREAMVEGSFPDNTILHQHSSYNRKLARELRNAPAFIVTIIRDPYDVFVSYHRWVQEPEREGRKGSEDHPRNQMLGRALDEPEVLTYLANEYGAVLRRAVNWSTSGESIVVRYEDLHEDPVAALRAVTARIEPVSDERIQAAIDACSIDTMRQSMGHTVKSGRVGDSKQKLTEAHLEVFRKHHEEAIRTLGYEVR